MFSIFLIFKTEVENQFSTKIKTFQCDGGGKYLNNQFKTFFQNHGIIYRVSYLYTPQQNGITKCTYHTHLNVVPTMLIQANKHPTFWVEALHTTVHISNHIPHRSLSWQSPYAFFFSQITNSHKFLYFLLCLLSIFSIM